MLRSMKDLMRYKIMARDGDIGKVHDFFFDDLTWTVNHVVVDTSRLKKRVLLPPMSLGHPEWSKEIIPVDLTKEQVKNSPDVDTDKPISRQHELALRKYYGWSPYSLVDERVDRIVAPEILPSEQEIAEANPDLFSARELLKYHTQATDGPIGHADDIIVEEQSWIIRYLVIDTRILLPGKSFLISPQWIANIEWADETIHLELSQEDIRQSPHYDPSQGVNRQLETRIYDYYGRPKYWTRES